MLNRPVEIEDKSLVKRAIIELIALAGFTSLLFNHRGFWRISRYLGRLVPRQYAVLTISRDSRFRINLSDPYWNRLISKSYNYEGEVSSILYMLRNVDYLFLDCGANFGYWSVLASSEALGAKPVVAVEPWTANFRELEHNQSLNGYRFSALQYAISSHSGKEIPLYYAGDHAAVSIMPKSRQTKGSPSEIEHVRTICIDDVIRQYAANPQLPITIKLDVEGSEIEALKGARRTLQTQCLLIYEDHGKDATCKVSRFVKDAIGYNIYGIHGCRIEKLKTLEEVRKIKVQKSKGYNFLATSEGSLFDGKLKERMPRQNR